MKKRAPQSATFRGLGRPTHRHEKRRSSGALHRVSMCSFYEGPNFGKSQSTNTSGMAVGYVKKEKTLFYVIMTPVGL